MIDLLIVLDYYRLLSERLFPCGVIIESFSRGIMQFFRSWIDKILKEKNTDRNKLLFFFIF